MSKQLNRKEMLAAIASKYPKVWTKLGEEFREDLNYTRGIWTGAGSYMETPSGKKVLIFDCRAEMDKRYELDVYIPFEKFLNSHGWFSESNDPETWMIWPIKQEAAPLVVNVGPKEHKANFEMLEALAASGYNVLVNKSNGYSHSWQEVVPYTPEMLADRKCKVTGTTYRNRIWFVKSPLGKVQGSSIVSFS